MVLGRKNLTIAEEPGISVGTTKVYKTRFFEKLAVSYRTQATYRAVETVFLSGEEP